MDKKQKIHYPLFKRTLKWTVNPMALAGRLIAVLLIAIPGMISAYGWSLMRDAIFNSFSMTEPFQVMKFIGGLILFGCGVAFIAGFFVHKDKKKNSKS